MRSVSMLLVAYQCGPGLGSVSQIGWEWFTGMAQRHAVCLVTHVRNRAAIEAAPDRPAQARVIYIDTEWFAGPLYRLARRLFPNSEHSVFMVAQLDYFVFDAVALRHLRRERRALTAAGDAAPWQLVHVVTPVTTAAPTRLGRLGLPMVRGPLNCGLAMPPGFPDVMKAESSGLSKLRFFPRLLEAVLGSLRNSHTILVATAATIDAVPAAARERCVKMIENAVELQRFAAAPALPNPGPGMPLKVSYVGRLMPFKALQLLLEAVARVRRSGRAVELVVAGDGSMAGPWRELAGTLGIADAVTWLGPVPLDRVAGVMQDSHVFCLPSIRESGGAVLLEAMACARPVIALNFGGPSEVVDDAVGWLLAMPDAATATAGIERVLSAIHDDPADAAARGRQGRERVLQRYTWSAKMDAATQLYEQILRVPAGLATDERTT